MNETKICKNCGHAKSLDLFKNEKRNADGKTNKCRECLNRKKREYRKNHPDLVRSQDKKRRNLSHVKTYMKNYWEDNFEDLAKKAKQRYETDKKPYLDRAKKQREKNPVKWKKYLKEWRTENRKYLNQYVLNKLHTDPLFKLKHKLRGALRKALNGKKKTNPTLKYLGCDINFLKGYLEAKFRDGMTWENHGLIWHIDHILPCRSFDLSKEKDIEKCFHYTNLQPLLASENLTKLDKLPNGNLARQGLTNVKSIV